MSDKCAQQQHLTSVFTTSQIIPSPRLGSLESRQPWVPADDLECQFKCCHSCRPTCELRSYLSLDGIVKGDIPPSAATGFGFHLVGTRPVMPVDIVQNIGSRAVPLHDFFPSNSLTIPSSPSSIWSILDCIDDQISELARKEQDDGPRPCDHKLRKYDPPLDISIDDNGQHKIAVVRPPWTPPTTPSSWDSTYKGAFGVFHSERHPNIFNGRSSKSLKSNPEVRNAIFKSVHVAVGTHDASLSSSNANNRRTYGLVDEYDVGLFLRFNRKVYTRACTTELPAATAEEEAYLCDASMPVTLEGEKQRRFSNASPNVSDGIAVMEESAELHVADILTQA
ncbi:hypothetical protein BX600DRAFT_258123 [Xylariales sp. PMI_506]|nr:hypothetical protein BX600DRAFT_258123 [Xylariales sp. PMI_506]